MMRSKHVLESLAAAAMIAALSACAGGGGGGGGDVLGGNVSVPGTPQYSDGGTKLADAPDGTEFPLLKTEGYYANGGGAISSQAEKWNASITPLADGTRLKVESVGLNVRFNNGTVVGDAVTYTKNVNGKLVVLQLYGALAGLDYMELGAWAVTDSGPTDAIVTVGVGVGGYETHPDDMPTTGSATYNGRMVGVAVDNSTGDAYDLIGKATMTANFTPGGGSVSGSFFETTATNVDTHANSGWNDVTFTGTITSNEFNGMTDVSVTNTNPGGLDAGASGVIEGKFFGPVVGEPAEAGGAWTLQDSNTVATGAFGGAQ